MALAAHASALTASQPSHRPLYLPRPL